MPNRPETSANDSLDQRPPTSHERMTGEPWDASYQGGRAPWDIGRPQQAFARVAAAGGFSGAVLDAGCGYGRNLVHLLRQGCEIFALDEDRDAINHVRKLSVSLETGLPAQNFQVGEIEQMPFPDAFADVVLCNSVLHFARDEAHFTKMLSELWRVLRPGGMLFCRLGSRIGMTFQRVRDNIYLIADGSEWFLVDEKMLLDLGEKMNAVLVDPLKTTIVQDYRCMTTWVLRKRT